MTVGKEASIPTIGAPIKEHPRISTQMEGDLTGRRFGIKEVGILGCSLMGAPIVGMLASFPTVKERVNHFDEELANSKIVIDALASIEGTKILSETPRQHTLTRLDTTGSFDVVAQTHKKRGFFLSSALSKKGIPELFREQPRSGRLTHTA